jgi:hypothetical protein
MVNFWRWDAIGSADTAHVVSNVLQNKPTHAVVNALEQFQTVRGICSNRNELGALFVRKFHQRVQILFLKLFIESHRLLLLLLLLMTLLLISCCPRAPTTASLSYKMITHTNVA